MFITFEGIEGSGKSTLVRLLNERLIEQGHRLCVTREPGGCALGETLRALLLNKAAHLSSEAELFLFLADRAQHVSEVIRPALAEGRAVLCDRYADSTIVYQGFGRGLDPESLYRMNDLAVGGLWPDVTFLLDMEPTGGLQRAKDRNTAHGSTETEGRFEAENLAFHTRIRQGFLQWAARWPQRFVVLDASQPPNTVLHLALAALA